jgi:hypothetical protein
VDDDNVDPLYAWAEDVDSWRAAYLPISTDLVLDLIELLQEHLARFEQPQGTPSEVHAAYRLMAGTSYALARLLALRAKSERHGSALELLQMVQHFLHDPAAAEHLHTLPRSRRDRDLVDALLALVHKAQEIPATAADAP